MIAITLSLSPLDAWQPGYQAPLTEDELHAAWIFDDELSQLGAMDFDEASGASAHRLVVPGTELLQQSGHRAAAAAGASLASDGAAAVGKGEQKHGKSLRKRKRGGGRGASHHGGRAPARTVAKEVARGQQEQQPLVPRSPILS